MLDENLPTYRFQPSSQNPQHTIINYTYQGSDPAPTYLLKRPAAESAPNQYAIGLLDVQYSSVIYGEILLKPQWVQPTLSAAEVRAQNGSPLAPVAITPDSFTVALYNPDQTIKVELQQGRWGKSDTWEFEIPEQSFKQPSASKLDQDGPALELETAPKVVFKWKKEGRKDMTCFMSGRSVGGKKNKEPDITVALFRAEKHDSAITIYEPNINRVDVEDRKGLEVVLLLTAEAIRDLYVAPRSDPFNAAGAPPPGRGPPRHSSPGRSGQQQAIPSMSGGAGGNVAPSSSSPPPRIGPQSQASVDAETRRLQQMVADEDRRAREQREKDEQRRIKEMLNKEEQERQRRNAEVDRETERLRREYGYDGPSPPPRRPQQQLSPNGLGGPYGSGAGGLGAPYGSMPQRPNSAGPRPHFAPPPSQTQDGGGGGSSSSGWKQILGRSEEDKKKKAKKKRSVHF